MPLYALDDIAPTLAQDAWVAPSADLIGDVRLGRRASVWFGAVIRADNTPIVIGEESNIQDGAVGHSDPGAPLTIGARVTVGHQAILHGCTIGDQSLVGMGARILNGAVIGAHSLVGAGALVTEGKIFDSGMLIVGAPARAIRALSDDEMAALALSAVHYADKAGRYAQGLRLHRRSLNVSADRAHLYVMIEIRPFASLGHADHGWLDARHHFSFASYHDPQRMGWGAIRVWNDDRIAARAGFPPHPHRDMEIITYVRSGAITHQDSLGNKGRTGAGDVQVMSAGTGVTHSEFNLEDEETSLFQIWIETSRPSAPPAWGMMPFPRTRAKAASRRSPVATSRMARSTSTPTPVSLVQRWPQGPASLIVPRLGVTYTSSPPLQCGSMGSRPAHATASRSSMRTKYGSRHCRTRNWCWSTRPDASRLASSSRPRHEARHRRAGGLRLFQNGN